MSGGKETPRQKMIGMMYLVLLAMLAMNVSKQIIVAFVTLDSKLGISERAIVSKNTGLYDQFDGKLAGATSKNVNWLSLIIPNDANTIKEYLEEFKETKYSNYDEFSQKKHFATQLIK